MKNGQISSDKYTLDLLESSTYDGSLRLYMMQFINSLQECNLSLILCSLFNVFTIEVDVFTMKLAVDHFDVQVTVGQIKIS